MALCDIKSILHGKVFLLENGMLSMTLTDGENKTTLYMTKEPEE